MRALDTNVLVRFIMRDDPRQTPVATALLNEPCFIADTVLIETVWVLSSVFGVRRSVLAATLIDLLELPSVAVAEPALLRWAVHRYDAGADLADMVHLVATRHAGPFASFDRRLAKAAGPDTPVPVETLA